MKNQELRSDQSPKLNQYSPAIDGLRAIAVISVIINHFNGNSLPSGYLGVDMFFTISGFVITQSFLGRNDSEAIKFFPGFYKRRIKRLLPALLFCFVVGGLLISFFNPSPQGHLKTGLFSLVGFSNLDLYFNAIDYWGGDAKLNPFTHTWSLGVEEQFYLIFPFLFWFFMARSHKAMLSILLALSFVSLLLFLYLDKINPMAAYFLLPARFWEIGLGASTAIFLYSHGINNVFNNIFSMLPFNLLLIILAAIFFMPLDTSVYATVAMVISTVFVIIKIKMMENNSSANKNILTHRTILYIGAISYSLYLWHWIIISISRWTVGIRIELLPIQIALIALFSIFSYHVIEKPCRESQWRSSTYSQIYLGCMLALSSSLIFINFYNVENSLYLGGRNEPQPSYEFKMNEALTCDEYRIENEKTILTIGNSHSIHIIPMLSVIGKECGIKLLKHKGPNYFDFPNGRGAKLKLIEDELSKLKKGDLLILSSRNRYLYSIPYMNGIGDKWIDHSLEIKEFGHGLDKWIAELKLLLDRAEKRNISVVLFLPNVEFDQKILSYEEMCKAEWFQAKKDGCDVSVDRQFLDSRFPSEFYQRVYEIDKNSKTLHVFDPMPVYCKNLDSCPRIVDGIVAFRDTNHLTPKGSLLMLDAFSLFLAENRLLESYATP